MRTAFGIYLVENFSNYVETADQVKQLKQIGCDYIQGFYFSKPLPAEEFYRYVSDTELRDVV